MLWNTQSPTAWWDLKTRTNRDEMNNKEPDHGKRHIQGTKQVTGIEYIYRNWVNM